MAATTTCTSSSSQSTPGVFVEIPSAPASQVPMNAATIPTTIVSQIGIGWRPGTTSRPSAPMIAPMMIAVMMPVTVIVPPSVVGPPVHGPYGRWMPEAGAFNAQESAMSLIVTFSCSADDTRRGPAGRHQERGEHRHHQRSEMDRGRGERLRDDDPPGGRKARSPPPHPLVVEVQQPHHQHEHR